MKVSHEHSIINPSVAHKILAWRKHHEADRNDRHSNV